MSANERAAAEKAERADTAAELAPDPGPNDPGRASSVRLSKESRRVSSSSERQFQVERAQKCLENAALVSKRIKERRRANAELLGKPFEDEETCDTASELASTTSVRTGYSAAASDRSPPMSVKDALNLPGISESLANTLKRKEIIMGRIKQYKELSKRDHPVGKPSKSTFTSRKPTSDVKEDAAQSQKPVDKWDPVLLQNTIKEKETALSIMQVKMRAMETTILDLQEIISEKDSLIEAKTKATSLMSDNLSKKEKDSLGLLEDTRQQMVKMQENFIAMENEWKEEKKRLLNDIELKNERINHLAQANSVLENARFEISLAHSKLSEEIELKNKLISDLELKLTNVAEQSGESKEIFEVEKGSQEISNMIEMTRRIELLEQLNCQIRQTNFELESKLAIFNPDPKTPEPIGQKKTSPQVTRKRGKSASRNTSAKVKSPWTSLAESSSQEINKNPKKSESVSDDIAKMEMIIQSLNKEIVDKEFIISQRDSVIESQQEVISQKEEEIRAYTSIKPETMDISLTCDGIKPISPEIYSVAVEDSLSEKGGKEQPLLTIEELHSQLKVAREQIALLNLELDAANKNMVKVKSAHKLKLKQMQKTIDNFSKMSDSNAEVSKLSDEVNQLTQKVAELEEDKGNLQLHLVDYDSGRLSESDSHRKLVELEALADARLKSISELETQKFDLVQELHLLQQQNKEMDEKLADLHQIQNEHVCTEMKSIQLEEQLDEAAAVKKELELVIENLKLDKEHSKQSIKDLQNNILELTNKLENYIQENIDLTDRLEKLSAEKVSSAESIEMVESLTAQEKIELEEYNKKNPFSSEPLTKSSDEKLTTEEFEKTEFNESLSKFTQESEELNKKIELFTQERHEVMEKMNELKQENENLHSKINEITMQKQYLETQMQQLLEEKDHINQFNSDLSNQIEKLKKEQMEILKENASLIKPASSEEAVLESESTLKDVIDGVSGDVTTHDDKPQALKTKPVKQLTKEILKLKNVIKEREAEIADCQMKILSLEEQQQKQSELLKKYSITENSLKTFVNENKQLREELATMKLQTENMASVQVYLNEIEVLKQSNEVLQNSIVNTQSEYAAMISARDMKIQELESFLLDYEGKITTYNRSLQQKDKDITEYLNQITQLNSVSQKLRSTIELLEEEKLNDQNDELIKNLNMQILKYQSLINEQDAKLNIFEEEKKQLMSIKLEFTEKNASLESEIKKLYNSLFDKDTRMKEFQELQKSQSEEVLNITEQCKQRDEEMHEIKLQLRKESIENENLRKSVSELEEYKNSCVLEIDQLKQDYEKKMNSRISEVNESLKVSELKNKELMEKLRRFAANLKKKSNICAELESHISGLHIEIEQKQKEIETLQTQVNESASLHDKIVSMSAELELIKSEGFHLEHNKIEELEAQLSVLLQEKSSLIEQARHLENNLISAKQEIEAFVYNNTSLSTDLRIQQQESQDLKARIDMLSNKLAEHEMEKNNNHDLITKISNLELEIHQKQLQISDLLSQIENIQLEFNTFKFGHDAKIQERDLFIENLESEISNYRSRISRLEESISIMEDRRHSLERKADQLGSQLEEKQKAYCDYTNNEDELVSRLAVLMDHDQVVDKQLHEIEKENTEMQNKMQKLIDENQHLQRNLHLAQEECLYLKDYSNKEHQVELDSAKQRIDHLETHIKKISSEYQIGMKQQKEEMNNLESEFNMQIENNIKEKKVISEKYEKIFETNNQLEQQLQEYLQNIKTLKESIHELNEINRSLSERLLKNDDINSQNYTDQYITEINNLQSIINGCNSEIENLRKLQTESNTTVSVMESKNKELDENILHKNKQLEFAMEQLHKSVSDVENLNKIIHQQESIVTELQSKLKEKDLQLAQFPIAEMSQHLTQSLDLDALSSQIIVEGEAPKVHADTSPIMIRAFEHEIPKIQQKLQEQVAGLPAVEEEVIVPKKSYLCYDEIAKEKAEQPTLYSNVEIDPFNSDEGWGLGESSLDSEKHDCIFEVNRLSSDNEKLKSEIANSNTKLAKALKKLKELKLSNDKLMNDLKTANQISQLNILDTTLEDELKNQINQLNNRIDELNAEISKGKREKEMLSKQNEIIKNANDRVMEMKEKLENEISIWKYKFQEANDKVSSFAWGEGQGLPQPTQTCQRDDIEKSVENSFLENIEKENDELNVLVDQLTKQNTELSMLKSNQSEEIISLNNVVSNLQSQLKMEQDNFESERLKMKSVIRDLESDICSIKDQPICQKCKMYDIELLQIKMQIDVLTNDNNSLLSTVKQLQLDIETARSECNRYENDNKILENEISKLKESLDRVNEQVSLKNTSCSGETEQAQLQEKCKILEENCQTLKLKLQDSTSMCHNLQSHINEVSDKIVAYEYKIADLEKKCSKLNEENDQLLSTVTELRSSVASAVDQRGYEVAEMWKHHLSQRETDFSNLEHELREQISAIESKYEHLLDNVQSSSQEETSKMIMMEQLSSLQVKLKDKEEHLISLQSKFSDMVSEMEMLRSEIEDEKLIHENKLLTQQDESEKQLKEIEIQHKNEIFNKDATIAELNTALEKIKENNHNLVTESQRSQETIDSLNNNISDLTNQVRMKDNEIYNKIQEYNIILNQRNEEFEVLKQQLIEYERKIEELGFEKESELAIMRLRIHEQSCDFDKEKSNYESEKAELVDKLTQKIEECTKLNKQLTDLNRSIEEDSARMSEMRSALESQELEIVTLKDEIENMQMLLETSAAKVAKHVTFASDTKPAADGETTTDSVQSEDAVPRAELDLALYMLHQRDMRCEELTMEVMGLLEERDTLQLRLSDSLRAHEELRVAAGLEATSAAPPALSPPAPSIAGAARASISGETLDDKASLHNKLHEARSVRQSRDVRLRQDSERRELDMQLLQRDVARLPPEAADQLRRAHYTLTRDSQSASTVLLNWLRGKSTPKVVHM